MNFILSLILPISVLASNCIHNLDSLKTILNNKDFPLQWIETTADDGKPLKMILSEKEGRLFLEFDKTKEGLWASGSTDVCQMEPYVLEAKINKKQIKLGKAAPWIMRMSMKAGAKFKLHFLEQNRLKIVTFGWSGEFIPTTVKY